MVESKKKKQTVSYSKWGYIFIIPFFVVYLIFTLYPQILTIYYSFCEYYKSAETMKWIGPNFVGFQNYVNLFKPSYSGEIKIFKYMWNTILLWAIGAIPQFIVALLLAVIFTSPRLNLKGQRFFKTVFYMPNLIMASAFSLLMYSVFSNVGPVNKMLESMGFPVYDFLANTGSVRMIIALINFLMWFGNTMILLMAGIQGIDDGLFESARIDGAGSFRIFKDITMPLLKPIFIYTFITSMIGGIQMFDVPQIITNGYGTPDETSMTLVMALNRQINVENYGKAGAISIVLFIVTALVSIVIFKTMARDEEK